MNTKMYIKKMHINWFYASLSTCSPCGIEGNGDFVVAAVYAVDGKGFFCGGNRHSRKMGKD